MDDPFSIDSNRFADHSVDSCAETSETSETGSLTDPVPPVPPVVGRDSGLETEPAGLEPG